MDNRDDDGRFMPGNRFWEARSSHGRNPLFTDPDALWDACCEYFEWNENNPLYEDNLVTFQGHATHEPLAKMRAMTIGGLCMFLDIDETTWRGWRAERTDLIPIIMRAEGVIYRQKFEGASASMLNPNIIARDLGLADKQEHTGKNGGPIQTADTTPAALIEEARRLGIDPAALGIG
ncbi:DNA-packaging protein [Sphingomonas aquatilis]